MLLVLEPDHSLTAVPFLFRHIWESIVQIEQDIAQHMCLVPFDLVAIVEKVSWSDLD